ncbi:hypothetical protein Tco_0151288 [Tanacetum coccineum]
MLSKPMKKTTHVSLALGFIPGPSSGVRGMARRTTVCFYQTEPPHDRQDPPNPGLLCMRAVLAKDRWLIGNTWMLTLEEKGRKGDKFFIELAASECFKDVHRLDTDGAKRCST